MASVRFTVVRELGHPAAAVFEALVDWPGHAAWVPLTRISVLEGDGGPGTRFVATSGIGPLALPDRMVVTALDEDAMTVDVEKIGPVLTGTVRLSVTAIDDARSRLSWFEDVRVPGLPAFLSAPVAAGARAAFSASISRLERQLG